MLFANRFYEGQLLSVRYERCEIRRSFTLFFAVRSAMIFIVSEILFKVFLFARSLFVSFIAVYRCSGVFGNLLSAIFALFAVIFAAIEVLVMLVFVFSAALSVLRISTSFLFAVRFLPVFGGSGFFYFCGCVLVFVLIGVFVFEVFSLIGLIETLFIVFVFGGDRFVRVGRRGFPFIFFG